MATWASWLWAACRPRLGGGQADDGQLGQVAGGQVGVGQLAQVGLGKPEPIVSFQITSSSVSGASNISENIRIHQKDSERCTRLFNSFLVTAVVWNSLSCRLNYQNSMFGFFSVVWALLNVPDRFKVIQH